MAVVEKMVLVSFFSVFFLLLLLPNQSLSIGCVGDDGKSVDWWVALKMPRRRGIDNPSVAQGLGYGYLDQRNPGGFELNSKSLDHPKSALFATLGQVYKKTSTAGYIMYNDADPSENTTSSHYAHAKGVLGFDKSGAFWLVHSMPGFPLPPSKSTKLEIDEEQQVYGQSMLCVSLTVDQANQIGRNLRIYNPQVYDSSFPGSLDKAYTALKDVAEKNGKIVEVTGFYNFTVPSGITFNHFAKHTKWNKDLYADYVSLWFSTGLLVETWQRPREESIYPPDSKFEIVDINVLKFTGLNDKYSWEQGSDHSKWVIGTTPSLGLVCIGDINRQKSQAKRGGGTVCFLNCAVYNAFSALIVDVDRFTKPSPSKSQCKSPRQAR